MDLLLLALILASQINFGQSLCRLLDGNQTYTCEDLCAGDDTADCDSISLSMTMEELCPPDTLILHITDNTVVNCNAQSDLNTTIIIAAASSGGGALLIICLLILCCCCCCCARQRRKRASIDIRANSTVEIPMIPQENSPSIENDLPNGGNNIMMQLNIALSDDSAANSHDNEPTPLTPLVTTSFINNGVKKSASSYEIHSRNNDGLEEDKGYVKMSSAGSIHNLGSEYDIYVEPDLAGTITSSHLLLPGPSSATPTHASLGNKKKPATKPKPAGLRGSPTSGRKPPPPFPKPAAVAAAAAVERGQGSDSSENEDDYESPQVFQEDLKKQSVEGYYNKDVVIIPNNKEDPSIDTEPQTLYENVDHLSIDLVSDDDESEQKEKDGDNGSYESVQNYLTGGDDKPEEGGNDRASTLYYNIPEVVGGASVDEDDMYMYMQAGHHMEQNPGRGNTTQRQTEERRRLLSEQVGQNKKYMNFTSEQKVQAQQYLQGLAAASSLTEEGNKADSAIDEAPLYVNFEKEEELYTAVT